LIVTGSKVTENDSPAPAPPVPVVVVSVVVPAPPVLLFPPCPPVPVCEAPPLLQAAKAKKTMKREARFGMGHLMIHYDP
jgi:hypothetical protein